MYDRYFNDVSHWEQFGNVVVDLYAIGLVITFIIGFLSYLREKNPAHKDLMAIFFLPAIWPLALIGLLSDEKSPDRTIYKKSPDRTIYNKPTVQDTVVDDAKKEKAPSIIAQMFQNLLSTAMTIILIIVLLFLLIWSLPFLT